MKKNIFPPSGVSSPSQESPQHHIQRLFKARALNDPNSVTLANTLSKDIETLFKGPHKFIFELLQNADDTGDAKQEIAVEFILSSSQLIFRHTGQPFNAQDVDKICDNAQQIHKDKISNSHKIGYKGIGFKALFSIADSVSIFSGGYHFQFNKHYSLWEGAPEDKPYPWPIIPIALSTAEQSQFAKRGLMTTMFQTVFIIDIKNPKSVASEFDFVQKHPELMLFFRHVRSITLQQDKKSTCIQLKSSPPLREIFCDGERKKSFISSCLFKIKIPESLRDELTKMSNFECPPKLKTAQTILLQFAVPLQSDGAKVQRSTYPLYCYLPTTVNLNLPYLVNTDFLLKPDRGELLENIWNAFLLEKIALTHFYWLKNLTKTIYRDQILWLVGKDTIHANLLFQNAYSRGFDKGKDSIDCIPSYLKEEGLLTLNQSIADKICFWRSFPELKDSSYPLGSMVRYELEGLDEQKYFGKIFSTTELTKNLASYVQQIKELSKYKKLLMFLCNLNSQRSIYYYTGDTLGVQNIPFLLCQNGRFVKPSEAYYLPKEQKIVELPETIKINCLNSALTEDNEKLTEWLCQLGIRPLTPTQIFKDEILPRLLDEKQTLSEHWALFQFAFKFMMAPEGLSTTLFEAYSKNLRKIRVVNVEKVFLTAEECYFHDDYKPLLSLISFTKDQTKFLSPLYLKFGNEKEIKKFFKNLGVRENLAIQRISPYDYKMAENSKNKLIIDYFDSHRFFNRSPNPNPTISLLIDLPILDFIHQGEQFIKAFWQQLIKNWDHLKKECTSITYSGTGRRGGPSLYSIPSFLQYRLKNSACLQASDGKFYKPAECYTAKFKKWLILPVIDYPKIPEDLIQFLGLKSTLTAEDCVKLLTYYGKESNPNIDLYAELFAHLAKQSDSIAYAIKEWQGRLPAQDNTLQPVTQLKFFGIKDRETPISSLWLKVIPPMSFEDRLKIAELFKIKIFTQEKPIVHVEDKKADSNVLTVFMPLLPALALVENRATNHSAAEILLRWRQLLKQLQIYSVAKLQLCWDPEAKSVQNQCAYLEEAILYYKGQWHIKKPTVVAELARYLQFSVDTSKAAAELIAFELPRDSTFLQEWLLEHDYSLEQYQEVISGKPQSVIPAKAQEPVLPKKESALIPDSTKNLDTLSELLEETSSSPSSVPLQEMKALHISASLPQNNSLSMHTEFHTLESPSSKRRIASLPPTSTIQKEESLDISSELEETVRSFVPEIQPEKIDMKAVRFIHAKPPRAASIGVVSVPQHPVSRMSSPSITPIIDTDLALPSQVVRKKTEIKDTSEIGTWGERFVYEKLISHYREKYPECTYKETTQGFQLQGFYQKNKSKEHLNLEVIWLNKGGETGASIDFKIIKNGRVRCVEVKTTYKSSQAEFFISSREWQIMMEQGNRFRLFQVFKAGQQDAYITKLKDPAAKIKAGEWVPQQARFRM